MAKGWGNDGTNKNLDVDEFMADHNRGWLDGFWNPVNAVPQRPKCVMGDAQEFQEDLERTARRARNYLNYLENTRYMVIEEWPEWALEAANWVEDEAT